MNIGPIRPIGPMNYTATAFLKEVKRMSPRRFKFVFVLSLIALAGLRVSAQDPLDSWQEFDQSISDSSSRITRSKDVARNCVRPSWSYFQGLRHQSVPSGTVVVYTKP